MPLETGSRLGPYEILGPLGAGGMGEVYRARDTRLGRDVAIKIIPEHLAGTQDLRVRFEREAKAVSSLNHPNICVLYDVGEQDGTDYIVMELLEGETLAARLERGPLPPAELLKFGIQIADALDKAHRKGLVHRDLKPGNVMITKNGAKLLDFGLARPIEAAGTTPGSMTQTPTLTRALTAEGAIVGTFQYMAPEQLEGSEADARSDLWALGATLYEMATATRAFAGKTQASLISSIMKDTPRSIAEVQPITPPGLDRVIQQCLKKDPDDRIQTAHDVRLQLEWVAEGGSQAGVPAPVAAGRRRRERGTLAGLVVASLVAVGALAWIATHLPKPGATIRFQYDPPTSVQTVDSPRISPDGRYVAFNATDSTGTTRIWLRALESLDVVPMPGTEGSARPFWSPDSRYIGFISAGKLKKVLVTGGPPLVVCDAPSGADGAWGRKDVILFDGRDRDPIMRVAAGGGVAVPMVNPDTSHGGELVGWPEFLPDGEHFVFLRAGSRSVLSLGSLSSKKTEELFPCDSRAQYTPPGVLLFSRSGTLVAQPVNPGTGKPHGDPIPIAQSVQANTVGGADFSVSKNGVLAYATRGGIQGRLVRVDREGRTAQESPLSGDLLHPVLSPDGTRIAMRIRDSQSQTRDIWVMDLKRGVTSRLSFEPQNENYPVWSPDGARVLYYCDRPDAPGLYVRPATGAGRSELVVASSVEAIGDDWTHDGQYVVYEKAAAQTREDIWLLPMGADHTPRPLLDGPFNETQARVSPDGRWIAYSSDESGRLEVYVQSFPEPGGKWQVSTRGGSDPVWRPDGKELFFLSSDQQMMAMPVAASGTFEVVVPAPLFPARVLSPVGPRNHYAVTADGSTFYIIAPIEGQAVGTTTVVVNWNAGLKLQ